MLHGFFKLLRQQELTGEAPEWSEGIEPEDHIRWCFDPGTIAIAKTVFTVVSTVAQVAGTIASGRAEQQAAQQRQRALEHQAAQARQIAGQERAVGQRAANEQRRQGRLLASRALARAAASGAGAADPTVENILGGIGAEGEFRALNELFVGESRARNLEFQADAKVFEGGQESRAGDARRAASQRLAFAQLASGGVKVGKSLETTASAGQGLSRFGFDNDFGISRRSRLR